MWYKEQKVRTPEQLNMQIYKIIIKTSGVMHV